LSPDFIRLTHFGWYSAEDSISPEPPPGRRRFGEQRGTQRRDHCNLHRSPAAMPLRSASWGLRRSTSNNGHRSAPGDRRCRSESCPCPFSLVWKCSTRMGASNCRDKPQFGTHHALPGRGVFHERGALGISGRVALEVSTSKLELAGLGLQPSRNCFGIVRAARFGQILLATSREPAIGVGGRCSGFSRHGRNSPFQWGIFFHEMCCGKISASNSASQSSSRHPSV